MVQKGQQLMAVFVCCFKLTGSHVIHINEDNYKVFRKKKMTGQSGRRLSFTTGNVWRSWGMTHNNIL